MFSEFKEFGRTCCNMRILLFFSQKNDRNMILSFFFHSVNICNITLLLFVERNMARI